MNLLRGIISMITLKLPDLLMAFIPVMVLVIVGCLHVGVRLSSIDTDMKWVKKILADMQCCDKNQPIKKE